MQSTATLSPGTLPAPDLEAIRRYRHRRLRQMMEEQGLPALLALDPINVRYITDARNMQVYCLNVDCRYVFVAANGPTILFEWRNTVELFRGLPTVDEVRPATTIGYVAEGGAETGAVDRWAAEIADLIDRHSPDDRRLGVDRLSFRAVSALARHGVGVVDGQPALYRARAVKSAEEVKAIRLAIAACDAGFAAMHDALEPGMTEVELWALLHQANIAWDGEFINCRLLSSGPRTNPWMQEASLRRIERGDFVAVDSDMIGPYGYAADVSRTWLAGSRPTDRQRRIYATAHQHVSRNAELFRAGRSFREIGEASVRLPPLYRDQMLDGFAHGLGLSNEWPVILASVRPERVGGYGGGYDGVLEAGMTLCIESYVGEAGGPDGVKLEQQILVTDGAPEVLSRFPFEESWL